MLNKAFLNIKLHLGLTLTHNEGYVETNFIDWILSVINAKKLINF